MTLIRSLAAVLGLFMVWRAISGLGVVTRAAKRISGGGTLEERVPVKGKGDEIDTQLHGELGVVPVLVR